MKLTNSFYITAFFTVFTVLAFFISVPTHAEDRQRYENSSYFADYSQDVMDSGTPPPVEPSDPDVTTGEAVIQIRDTLSFLVYGYIPLVIACVIIYIFLHWIYGLLIHCV